LLQIRPYSISFAKISKVCSSGLTDLRYGYIIDEDWDNEQVRKIIPLLQYVQWYFIATATSDKDSSKLANHPTGDDLVTIPSA